VSDPFIHHPPAPPPLCLTAYEVRELTGGLHQPRCQVKMLQERGFVRARLERGRVVLERAHYEAVCRGEYTVAAPPGSRDTARPRLKSVRA
jgi:hypothetical protein